MQSSEWIGLIGRIPADKHDCLCFVTTGGLHINLQAIVCRAQDFLVVRGRIAGSTDAGYTFLLPYDQMECVYFQKPVSEEEAIAWFGATGAPVEVAAPVARPTAAGGAPVPAPAPLPIPAPAAPVPGAPALATAGIQTRSGSIPLPGKAAILERLRKRTGSSSPGTIPKPPLTGPGPGATPTPPPEPGK
jgi:hypothetical protein